MATGSFNLTKSANNSSGSYIIGKIEWSSTKNIEGNYSTVTATLYCRKLNDSMTLTSSTGGSWAYVLTVAGSQITGKTSTRILSDWVAIATITAPNVSHNADGTKSINIVASVTAPTGTSYEGLTTGGSKSVALDTIPRASTVTATNADIGSKTTITINRASSSFTHSINCSWEGGSQAIAIKTTNTSISWTVPTSLYTYSTAKNAKSVTCKITCTTYNGSTQVGTSTTCTFIATANESLCKPTLAPAYYDANSATVALTGSNIKFVRYFSTAQLATGAVARNSATLTSQKITCGNQSKNAGSATFTNIESGTFVYSATDSRGYTTTQTINATMVPYVKPTCVLEKTGTKANGYVTITISGSFYNGSFGAKNNELTLYYRMKEKGGSYTSDIKLANPTINGNTYTLTTTLYTDYQKSYVFQAYVTDSLTSATSAEVPIKVTPVFDWGENDFKFNVPVILPRSYYFDDEATGGHGGLDVNNSDIVGLNNLLFRDKSDGAGESIRFYKDGTNWDCLYVIDGVVYMTPNYPANTKAFVIFHPDNKPYYEAGDKVTVYSTYPGWVSGGSKEFYISIPLSKPIIATTISVSGSVVGRGINGYVLGSNTTRIDLAGGTGYSVEVVKQPDGLKLDIIYEAAQTSGITNNTPINWYGEVTITFS